MLKRTADFSMVRVSSSRGPQATTARWPLPSLCSVTAEPDFTLRAKTKQNGLVTSTRFYSCNSKNILTSEGKNKVKKTSAGSVSGTQPCRGRTVITFNEKMLNSAIIHALCCLQASLVNYCFLSHEYDRFVQFSIISHNRTHVIVWQTYKHHYNWKKCFIASNLPAWVKLSESSKPWDL